MSCESLRKKREVTSFNQENKVLRCQQYVLKSYIHPPSVHSSLYYLFLFHMIVGY